MGYIHQIFWVISINILGYIHQIVFEPNAAIFCYKKFPGELLHQADLAGGAAPPQPQCGAPRPQAGECDAARGQLEDHQADRLWPVKEDSAWCGGQGNVGDS